MDEKVNGILMTDERRHADTMRRAEEAQKLQDICDIVATEAGQRVMARLLKDSGLNRCLADDAASIARFNQGMQLWQTLKAAHPAHALEILKNVFEL